MNRRDFFAKSIGGLFILPSALTYSRVWKPKKPIITNYPSFPMDFVYSKRFPLNAMVIVEEGYIVMDSRVLSSIKL